MEEKTEVASMVRGSRASRLWSRRSLSVAGVRGVLARSLRCRSWHRSLRFALPACVKDKLRARRAKIKPTVAACVALFSAACFAGCAPQSATNTNGSGFSVSTPSAASAEEAMPDRAPRLAPRSLEIKLTIASVADLRVRPGQHVNAGDSLSDRRIERAPLEAMRQQTQIALDLIIHPKRQPQPQLAPDFTQTEQAAITRAERAEEDARRKVEKTDARIRALGQLASLPPSLRATVEQHETATREQLERDRAQAERELAVARAQAENARKVRATAEYMNAREVSTQMTAEDEKLQTAAKDEATLRAQLASFDYQINLLGVVRAPFSGTIKRISWEGQQDHDLTAIVSLSVDDPDAKPERAK